eukprot:COSAG01_NODE_4834_length_4701_cov_158.807692_7_plen_118_part_00
MVVVHKQFMYTNDVHARSALQSRKPIATVCVDRSLYVQFRLSRQLASAPSITVNARLGVGCHGSMSPKRNCVAYCGAIFVVIDMSKGPTTPKSLPLRNSPYCSHGGQYCSCPLSSQY